LAAKGRNGEREVSIDDLSGLAHSHPAVAFAFAVCMLSLLGFPGTAGFIGKWYILVAAASSGQGLLAAILVLTSVISAGYYLPLIRAMSMKPEPSAQTPSGVRLDGWGRAVVAAAVAGMLVLGVQPSGLLDLARESGASLHAAAVGPQTPPPQLSRTGH